MGKFKFSEMVKAAKDSGALADSPPDGEYDLEVVGASAGNTKAGDPRYGIRFKVVGGPEDGKAFWENVNFIGSNPQNLAISFEFFRKLGVGDEFWETEPDDEAVKARILEIGKIHAKVKFVTKGDFTNVRFNNVKVLGQNVNTSAPSIPSAPVPAGAIPGASVPSAVTSTAPATPAGRPF